MAVTPFKENGDVDYEGYRQNIRWLVDKIKDFENCTLTLCGSNGEFPTCPTRNTSGLCKSVWKK